MAQAGMGRRRRRKLRWAAAALAAFWAVAIAVSASILAWPWAATHWPLLRTMGEWSEGPSGYHEAYLSDDVLVLEYEQRTSIAATKAASRHLRRFMQGHRRPSDDPFRSTEPTTNGSR